MLSGELAVPCCLQSATVGLNGTGGFVRGKQEGVRSVDTKVLCNVTLLTVSGRERSSTTQFDRVPQGCFGVAACADTVSACNVNRTAQFLKTQGTAFRSPFLSALIILPRKVALFGLSLPNMSRKTRTVCKIRYISLPISFLRRQIIFFSRRDM